MTTVTVTSIDNYQMLTATEDHAWIADEPKGTGTGLGPDPYQLLLGSLGSCTAMTLVMYARRKKWPLQSVKVSLSHERIHAEDCEDCEQETGLIDRIAIRMHLEGDLTQEQRDRLAEIATRCPVHKTLQARPHIVHEVD